MSHTFEAPSTKKEFRLPRKLLIEKARKDDVVLPPRTQLHVDPHEVDNERGEHDEATCIHCQAEMDTEYDIGSDGFCHYVGQENITLCTLR